MSHSKFASLPWNRAIVAFAWSCLAGAAPVCQIKPLPTVTAGQIVTLSGAADGCTGPCTYKWSYLPHSAPTRASKGIWPPLLSNTASAAASVKLMSPGEYTFELAVSDSAGSSKCALTTRAFPPRVVQQAFSLQSVPGAVSVRCTGQKADGSEVSHVAAKSPCVVLGDSSTTSMRLEYISDLGKVLKVDPKQATQPPPRNPSLHTTVFPYSDAVPYRSPNAGWPGLATWLGAHFDRVVAGGLKPVPPDGKSTHWSTYQESAYFYAGTIETLKTTARNNSWNAEDMLLHISDDYVVSQYIPSGAAVWATMDQFDAFEKLGDGTWQPQVAVNGVFTSSGNKYTDVTAQSYTGSTATRISDKLYVGYAEPFDQMNFTLSQGRSGGSLVYEFWNGSNWVSLPIQTDNTNGLAKDGKVYFYPPSTWKPSAVNGSHVKYWVRISVSNASVPPTYNTLKGDDWRTSAGAYSGRGWTATAAGRINVGLGNLEYNPTPPQGHSARFRYQSRVGGLFGANVHIGNPSNIQSGIRTWAQYLIDQIVATALRQPVDSIMLDDAAGMPTFSSPADPLTRMDFDQSSTYSRESLDTLSVMKSALQTLRPDIAEVGFNTQDVEVARVGDWALSETGFFAYSPSYINPAYTAGNVPVDAFVSERNPNQTQLVVGVIDSLYYWAFPFNFSHNWHPMDNSDRTPIMSLAAFYIGSNPNLSFEYNANASFGFYLITDEVYTWARPLTITSQIEPNAWNTLNQTLVNVTVQSGVATATTIGSHGLTTANTIVVRSQTGALNQNSAVPVTEVPSSTTFSWATKAADGVYADVFLNINSDRQTSIPLSGNTCQDPLINFKNSPMIRLGDLKTGDTLAAVTANSSARTFVTKDWIWRRYPSGANAYCVQESHLAQMTQPPTVDQVFRWGVWFPAMAVDIGTPDPTGFNEGNRAVRPKPWITGAAITGLASVAQCDPSKVGQHCSDVWRRDFTKAVVLFRPYSDEYSEFELDTSSQPFCINPNEKYPGCSGSWYPLHADGRTAAPVSSFSLRAGEGAILMLAPTAP